MGYSSGGWHGFDSLDMSLLLGACSVRSSAEVRARLKAWRNIRKRSKKLDDNIQRSLEVGFADISIHELRWVLGGGGGG